MNNIYIDATTDQVLADRARETDMSKAYLFRRYLATGIAAVRGGLTKPELSETPERWC